MLPEILFLRLGISERSTDMGKWSDWFSGSNDGSEAKYKNGQDEKDGGFRSERLTTTDGDKHHYHDVAKTSTDGTQYKEMYMPEKSNDR